VMSMDFVEALTARGLSRRRVMVHAFHNTVPSLLTVAGLQIGYLLGGVVFVEAVFAWPGLGSLAASAVGSRDYPLLMGSSLLVAGLVVTSGFATDLGYALLDPRVRLG
jgi:peptide/nickel transport system permease protein